MVVISTVEDGRMTRIYAMADLDKLTRLKNLGPNWPGSRCCVVLEGTENSRQPVSSAMGSGSSFPPFPEYTRVGGLLQGPLMC